jgi:hypothetical protein
MKNRILRSWWRRLLLIAIALVVVGVFTWRLPPRGRFLAGGGGVTAMYVKYDMPYPWPSGNYFDVIPGGQFLQERHLPWLSRYVRGGPGWTVVNMYAENHTAIAQQQGIRWTEVERLRDGLCAVVDSRIPRSWLSPLPLRVSLAERRRLRLERPELFAMDPESETFVGTSWILTERKDPDGFLERLLPGRRIEFERVGLRCSEPGDAAAERRTWELRAETPPNALLVDPSTDYSRLTLAVYELHGETYEGVAVGLTCDGDTMKLALGSPNGPYSYRACVLPSSDFASAVTFPLPIASSEAVTGLLLSDRLDRALVCAYRWKQSTDKA